jgi:Ca-activated chloride channel family protein
LEQATGAQPASSQYNVAIDSSKEPLPLEGVLRRGDTVRLRTSIDLAALILLVFGFSPWTPGQSGSQTTPIPASRPTDVQETSQAQQPENDSGTFVFRKTVDEVVLHATVLDDKRRQVNNLDRGAFTIYEDGKQQAITSFRNEDMPVSMGVIIDNSGSMREKRTTVNQAALNLVRASNPHDEVFIVNFNDEYYLDQPFTNNLSKLKEALERYETRGGTALYDAVVASADYLKKNARLEKKVLFVVTDGEDNASRETLEKTLARVTEENGPTIYSLGLLGGEKQRRARRALEAIAERTGGVPFFPRTLDEVDNISRTVAHDIRNQYTIAYKPTNPQNAGGYRSVKVEARAPGHGKLQVRTRTGYYAGTNRAAR